MPRELTKQAIVSSFIKLLNERPLSKIAVKDIVEDCGINRNTFYYHFKDIFDLVEYIFKIESENVINKNKEHLTWQDGLIESAEFALKNKKAIYHVYNSVNRAQLEGYIDSIADDLMRDFVMAQGADLNVSEADINCISLFYKHAIVGSIMEWIQKGMKDNAEDTIHRIGKLFDGNIREALLRACKQ